MNQDELAEPFRNLGAPDPEGWARSQAAEWIPQLVRRGVSVGQRGAVLRRFDESKLRWDKFFASRANALEALGQRE